MKLNKSIWLVSCMVFGLSACVSSGDDPGVEYAPDMYVYKGYEPYSQLADEDRSVTYDGVKYAINKDGKNMREPVAGTVARGKDDYYFPYKAQDAVEKAKAGVEMKNPLTLTRENLDAGRRLYNINCLPCHGEKGLGNGLVSAKYPPNYIPSYKSQRITSMADGSLYYSIALGWNLMGGYGKVLNPTERWQVVHYVNYLEKN
jgi:mono/diheme cytochrome c family protein